MNKSHKNSKTPSTSPLPLKFSGSASPKASPIRILIAEDHTVVRDGLAAIIRQEADLEIVAEASNGREAVHLWKQQRPDVALMDLQMPVLDGFETLCAIRNETTADRPRIPIVALTAHNMKGDRERCLGAGFDAFIPKPIQSKELYDVIESLLAVK